MGNPFLLATDFQPTVTYGIISGVHRYQYPAGTLLEYTDCLQTDASINPGNSGGPLFDAAGPADRHQRPRLVRETRPGERRRRLRHLDQPDQELPRLPAQRPDRRPRHARRHASALDDRGPRRGRPTSSNTSDAYRRGLRYDDEIVSFAGRPIATPNGFKNVLGIFPKGWRVPLSYRRDGKRYDILVRLAGVHGEEELIEKADGPAAGRCRCRMPKPGRGAEAGAAQARREAGKPTNRTRAAAPAASAARRCRHGRKPPMPEIVKKHFEEKRGYANYYFNTLQPATGCGRRGPPGRLRRPRRHLDARRRVGRRRQVPLRADRRRGAC